MATQEQRELFRVSIADIANSPAVIARIERDYTDYQEIRRYPSLPDLVSQVTRERVLGKHKLFVGIATALVGEVSFGVSAFAITFSGNFGEYDALIKILTFMTGVGSAFGGALLAIDGTDESRLASAILGQVRTTGGHSIAPTPAPS